MRSGSLRVKRIGGRWVLRRRQVARFRDPWFRRHRLAAIGLGVVASAFMASILVVAIRLVAGAL